MKNQISQRLAVFVILIAAAFSIFFILENSVPLMSEHKLLSEIAQDLHIFRKSAHSKKGTYYLRCLVKEAEHRGLSYSENVKYAKAFLSGREGRLSEYGDIGKGIDVVKPVNFLELAKKRQSIRIFLDKEIPDKIIKTLLGAAIEAPSSCNRQGWRFLIIKDEKSKYFVADWRQELFLKDAPLIICVLIDTGLYRGSGEEQLQFMDGSAAIMNIIYAAESMGLNSCWVNCFHTKEKRKAFRQYFKLDNNLLPVSFVVLGYGDQRVKKPAREPVEYYLLN